MLKKESFTVDAALIRELGETLIGRAHIALGELVKNSFDADAHTCEIEILNDTIVVSDNGHGISEDEFHEYWMRLGTTHKVSKRQSRKLKRSMTGSKGLGRLSVQFLANEMELESNCPGNEGSMLYAVIDWRKIHSGQELQSIEVEWELRSESSNYAEGSPTGTKIKLKGLKTNWDENAIAELGGDVWMLRSPFRDKNRSGSLRTALDFHIDLRAPEIKNATERFDTLHNALFNNWKARITGVLQDARRGSRESTASFTLEFADDYPQGVASPTTFHETVAFPIIRNKGKSQTNSDLNVESSDDTSIENNVEYEMRVADTPALDKARFTILVFKPTGKQPGGLAVGEVRDYLKRYGDVSVYDAGFRLPYYGSEELSGQDWLNVGADQGRRLITSELLPERLRIEGRYLLDLPNPGRLFGAVEVDTNHEQQTAIRTSNRTEWLQIQPGRDRLAPNLPFEQLRDFVRFGLDLYANRYRALADEVANEQLSKEPPSRVLDSAVSVLSANRSEMPPKVYRAVRTELLAARKAAMTESRAVDAHAALLGPLATAGMSALAMNHELSHDEDLLENIESELSQLSKTNESPLLKTAINSIKLYRSHLRSYRLLFAPLTEPSDRQALSRIPVKTVVRHVVDALKSRLAGVDFDLNHIPPKLLFPVGAFAEWSAIVQNILFNAWNAMLESDVRHVRFEGASAQAKSFFLRVSDTGAGLNIPVEESSLLFEAFERRMPISSANRSIAIGGQGLGLAIVRMIANSRGVSVSFVEPQRDYSTAIELTW